MANKTTEQIIIGALMKKPLLLSEVDKYILTIDDFKEKVMQHIFYAIASIAQDGATRIELQDIDLFLEKTPTGHSIFKAANGLDLLNDSMQLANEESFDTYYNLLKKENLLEDLKDNKVFDVSEFYEVNPITKEAILINDKFNDLTVTDILGKISEKYFKIANKYQKEDSTETRDGYQGIEDLLAELEESPMVGLPFVGDIYNRVCSGARKGKFYIRSGSTAVGKTRQAVMDALHFSIPITYNHNTCSWEMTGLNEKTLLIITEQDYKEIDLMKLAYISGIPQEEIERLKFMSVEKKSIVYKASKILEHFKDNLLIVRMPSPTIESVKSIVRKHAIVDGVEFVFYDYIFVSPSLLREFKGFNLRNDEVLLMFSDALKNLAVELDIPVCSSTQVNSNADSSKEIRNEAGLAGSRAVANKADVGSIMARPTKEELTALESIIVKFGARAPNVVTDIYKNRGSRFTHVRIWSHVNLDTLRKEDLFITDSRLEVIDIELDNFDFTEGLEEVVKPIIDRLN